MVVKVYVSGISGSKEVKKRQQRVLLILDSKHVKYEVIDIAEPGAEEAKDFVHSNSTSVGSTISDPSPRHPLPPQIFNDDVYCGDYDMFDMANEIDEMEKFLKLEVTNLTAVDETPKLKNGEVASDEEPEKPDAAEENDASKGRENEANEQKEGSKENGAGEDAAEEEQTKEGSPEKADNE